MVKKYKTWELYMCLALNRLVSELDIDLYQDNLEDKIEEILEERDVKVPKVEISYEIKSNHHMTNKILKKLEEMGLIQIEQDGRSYNIYMSYFAGSIVVWICCGKCHILSAMPIVAGDELNYVVDIY